ncbi:hypothetical protein B0T17DRAFT_611304 [Bombardia bombarda]|uniref:FAD-binding PCMH-type domain-containing protein n=1 Tax=Bombardia bombarda TaxID=252184 RepID=A0AA39XHT7_9PEZI|nr:hypothetical protein B0T17DRAFT_611304 [Bombardia bombarda]
MEVLNNNTWTPRSGEKTGNPESLSSLAPAFSSFFKTVCANQAALRPAISTDDAVCRTIPGDASWPNRYDWAALNATVNGRLIATVPIAAPCHNSFTGQGYPNKPLSTYNEDQCAALRNSWYLPETQMASSSAPMSYTQSNNSCNPWLDPDTPCTIGGLAVYAIDAASLTHIQAGLAFARVHNIRIVIRNSGHDYMGKSTGAHSLALWTHNLNSLQLISSYAGPGTTAGTSYTGPAIKIGAGVHGHDAYAFASTHNLVVISGNCPTVGIAGGYSQGGGHGPLASLHGLGADQVLSWEVILAGGTLVTADSTTHPDLYWALRGGGGGTYGVVVSMTVKAHPDSYASTAFITVLDNGTNTDAIYSAIGSFMSTLPSIVDAGIYALFLATPQGFFVTPAFAHGKHQAELDALLQPTVQELEKLGLAYSYASIEFPTFLAAYEALPLLWNVSQHNTGGRLIPRDLLTTNPAGLLSAIRNVGSQTLFSGVAFNVSHSVSSPDENAVNPYFRESIFNVFLGVPIDYFNWTANLATMDHITNELLPPLEALTPNGAAYMNEADPQQSDFKEVFFGAHYPRLLQIKDKYDPHGMFYAVTAVGSDRWAEQSDGRLCRV